MVVALMICDSKFLNESTGYSVMFYDDGRVAYAYLLDPCERIVGDVWLYNRCESPLQPEWENKDNKMPFANPASYSKDHTSFSVVSNASEVSVGWDDGKVIRASIFIRGNLSAILSSESKPGWSVMAKRNGPLAKIMELL